METKEYTIKTINELCTKITDGSHFSPEHDENGVYPMYSSKDMLYDGFDDSDVKRISEPVYKKLVKQDCRPLKNDILIIKDGNSYLKRIFKINTDIDAVILSSIAILRPNVKIIDPDFFKYLLRSDSIRNAMANYVSGAAIPRIVLKDFKKMKLEFISSMKAQQKIASILSAYDNLIQNYKKQIEALQTAASELYKEWFVRFRFPRYQTTKFENGIPKGWKVEKLGTLANISTGKCNREDAEEDGIYPLFDRSQEIKKSNEWIKDCEAIIVPGEGTSFIPRYYKGKFNLHQRCYCVEPKYPNFGKFLFYVLMLNRKYFLSVATGATVPSLRYNNFASMKFVLPEMSLCNNFNKIADDIFAKVDNLQQQITNLTQQRDLLLPRLMSGKLEME